VGEIAGRFRMGSWKRLNHKLYLPGERKDKSAASNQVDK